MQPKSAETLILCTKSDHLPATAHSSLPWVSELQVTIWPFCNELRTDCRHQQPLPAGESTKTWEECERIKKKPILLVEGKVTHVWFITILKKTQFSVISSFFAAEENKAVLYLRTAIPTLHFQQIFEPKGKSYLRRGSQTKIRTFSLFITNSIWRM